MNIVLDVNVVLDLLLKRRSEYAEQAHCFTQLAKAGASSGSPLVLYLLSTRCINWNSNVFNKLTKSVRYGTPSNYLDSNWIPL
jgi:hypothetical protein